MARIPLTNRQLTIVALIGQGYDARDDISEELGISRNTVRREIATLCSRYGVPTYDLPTAVAQEANWEFPETTEEGFTKMRRPR